MTILQNLWHAFETWAWGWGGLAGLIGVIALALWFFTPAFLSTTEARAILLNIGIGCIAFAFLSVYFINVGYKSCADLIASRDQAAIARSREAVKEIESCRDNGGEWNVLDGTCIPRPQ